MIDDSKVYDIYDKFGVEDNEVVIEQFTKIISDNETSNIVKSKAYCGMGDLIIFFDPFSREDGGYGYYKKALEYDPNNLVARIGICIVFDAYPEPYSEIVPEKEYLENLAILLDKFYEIDENNKKNVIQLMKSFVQNRLESI